MPIVLSPSGLLVEAQLRPLLLSAKGPSRPVFHIVPPTECVIPKNLTVRHWLSEVTATVCCTTFVTKTGGRNDRNRT